MKLSENDFKNYTAILREELIPAMGCTEPIAIAYAAAMTRKLLGEMPIRITVNCSGNIIKNVKGVTVPNSGGQKGIEVAAILGMVGGDPDKKLEVIAGVTDEDREECRRLNETKICDVNLSEDVPNLYIEIIMESEEHTACVRIAYHHTDIVYMSKNQEVLRDVEHEVKEEATQGIVCTDRNKMSLQGLLEYANTVDLAEIKDVIQRQIEMNSRISQEGLDNAWGAQIGKTILGNWGHDVRTEACAAAAAGSDARMSGCPLPVVINSGSGNQGITVSVPVMVYAEELNVEKEKLYRALALSNLTAIHEKTPIGRLSAYCGAVNAGAGAGAGIAYLCGGGYEEVIHTVVNALAIVSGIVCDGAKASCAAKIASAVDAGILGYNMYIRGQEFYGGDGIVTKGVEATLRNVGRLGKEGMRETNEEIIKMMIED